MCLKKKILRKKGTRYLLKPNPSNERQLILFRIKINKKNNTTKHLQAVKASDQDTLYTQIHEQSRHAGIFLFIFFFYLYFFLFIFLFIF